MSEGEPLPEETANANIQNEEEEEKEEEDKEEGDEEEESEGLITDYGEDNLEVKSVVGEFGGETEGLDFDKDAGEYGEGAHYFVYAPSAEAVEYPIWEEKEESITTEASAVESEVEETEEEREIRREREMLIEAVRQNLLERMLIRRKNAFLHKKLADYYRKRKMNNVFKPDPKGLDLEKKYLSRLYAFQEFKLAQENEIEELTQSMDDFQKSTNELQETLSEKLHNFMTKAKEISLNLILSKSGKRLNEKKVDLLLSRQIKKNEEKGKKKLAYIKVRQAIDETERQLKALEDIGDGLHLVKYEQMKIDYQNYNDKIEEKDEEITKIKLKTEAIMINLTQVREKTRALEEDIELSREKVYEVEKKFAQTRERVTKSRAKRDNLREESVRLKSASGLLTKDALLFDFESSINESKYLAKSLEKLKRLTSKKEAELSKIALPSVTESIPLDFGLKVFHKSKAKIF